MLIQYAGECEGCSPLLVNLSSMLIVCEGCPLCVIKTLQVALFLVLF